MQAKLKIYALRALLDASTRRNKITLKNNVAAASLIVNEIFEECDALPLNSRPENLRHFEGKLADFKTNFENALKRKRQTGFPVKTWLERAHSSLVLCEIDIE